MTFADDAAKDGRRVASVAGGSDVTVSEKIGGDGGLDVGRPRPDGRWTSSDDHGNDAPDKVAVERSTDREGGKTLTGQSKKRTTSSRAIVEVLDRVDTPLTSAEIGDGGANGNEVIGDATAFSVLPDAGRDEQRPCKCPECRKKPPRPSMSKRDRIILSHFLYFSSVFPDVTLYYLYFVPTSSVI